MGVYDFFINGYISISLDSPTEKIVGAISSIFSPRLDDGLVLGLGSGATASTVALLFNRTDAVEINPVVCENLHRMRLWNYGIEDNPRAKIIVDDAIHFLKGTDETYSMILNTVTTPLYFSSSKLYTQDFLEIVRKHLTPDGIYVTWLDNRVGELGIDIILNTLRQSFDHCAILYISPSYFLLIASQAPIQAHHPEAPAENEIINPDFLMAQYLDPHLLPYHLLKTKAYDLIYDEAAPINTSDRPSLEFEMAKLREETIVSFKQRLHKSLDFAELAQALSKASNYASENFAVEADSLVGDSWIKGAFYSLTQEPKDSFRKKVEQVLADQEIKRESLADQSWSHHENGLALFQAGQYQEALHEFMEAQRLSPEHDNAHASIGICYEAMGKLELALKHYDLEKELDPRDQQNLFRLASVNLKLKSYKAAKTAIQSAIEIQPDGQSYFLKAQILEGAGEIAQAKESYKLALSSGHDAEQVRQALKRL